MLYLDDILVFSKAFDEHLDSTERVFARLARVDLKIRAKKCDWARTELNYLGHVLNSQGKKPDPSKVEGISLLDAPRNLKDVESFLGSRLLSQIHPEFRLVGVQS